LTLAEKFGGQHHGFSCHRTGEPYRARPVQLPSLALHQQCRSDAIQDPQCQAARGYAEKIRRMISYERSFLRPLFADHFPDLGGVT